MRRIERVNGWLRVPYDGSPNASLKIQVNNEEPQRAFYDRDKMGGWAQIRSNSIGSITLYASGNKLNTWQ